MKQAMDNIRQMSMHERALLAHCLISSLDKTQEEEVDELWAQVAETRWAQLESGKMQGLSWLEIKKGLQG